jgi:hypothetical protein
MVERSGKTPKNRAPYINIPFAHCLLMLRRAQQHVGSVQGGSSGVTAPSPGKKSKAAGSSAGSVGDIEDLADFIHHKESLHQFVEGETEGIRTKLLEVYWNLLLHLSYHLIVV